MTLDEALWQDPARMSGAVCFRNTRVPIWMLFDHIALGKLNEFYDGFEIPQEQVEAVLREASRLIEREICEPTARAA